MDIKIYFDEDSDYSEFLYCNKDYRLGVIVVQNDSKYRINIYGITRLNQEFNDSINNNEVFYVEPNLIVVEKVTKQSIIKAILEICKEFNFLQQLKIEDNIDLSRYVNVY